MPSVPPKQAALDRATPLAGRVTVTIAQAAVMSGIPLTKLGELLTSGLVRSVMIGRSRMVNVASLLDVLEGRRVLPRRSEWKKAKKKS